MKELALTTIKVPISIGEFLDKITILEIKSARISDPSKVASVKQELSALGKAASENGIDCNQRLVTDLKKVNEQLWDIEDKIRLKEKGHAFDAEFIELARAVYITNDRRFALKNEINSKFGSQYTEQKSYEKY
jgi:hypothetical protein